MRTMFYFLLFSISFLSAQTTPSFISNLSGEDKAVLKEYDSDSLYRAWQIYLRRQIAEHTTRSIPKNITIAPAEYAGAEGVCFAWKGFSSLLKPLIKEVAKDAKAMVVVSSYNAEWVRAELEDAGCNMVNVELLETSVNSIWMRDYGPWFIYTQSGDREVIDLVYNRPRPADDKFPSFLANHYNWPSYLCSLVLPGGNLILDGNGVAIMTDVVFDADQGGNPDLTIEELRVYMKNYFNCHTVYILEDMERDGTGHIDMFCKMLDNRTILVGEYAKPGDGAGDNYHILNRNAQKLQQAINGRGEKFIVKRIPMPPYNGVTYTYTNSLIVNDKVLVPIYGKSQDNQGLEVYRNLLPNHKTIGYDCSRIIHSNGAIHCITKLVMADPLIVNHSPQTIARTGKHLFKTQVKTRPNIAVQRVNLYWKTENERAFHSLLMTSFDNKNFSGEIVTPRNGSKLQYYIKAEDETGMYETWPEQAESKYHTITIIR